MAQRLPPPPSGKPATNAPAVESPDASRFAITSGRIDGPQRVVIYGTGGIGKTSLAALAPNPVFVDLEHGTESLDVPRVQIGDDGWTAMRALLQSDKLDGFGTVVIDGATKAEEMAVAHTLATVPHEKGNRVHRLEDYGFGKGYQHVYETYLLLLQDLDSQVRRGRNVVLIAHDCISDVPNPQGDNFIRYEPHLQAPKSGKASIRNRVVQWAHHVLFVGYDVAADRGKGYGSGTRTIYTQEMPSHVAKTRCLDIPASMPFERGNGDVWSMLTGGAK